MTEYPYEFFALSGGAYKLEFPDLPMLQFIGRDVDVLHTEAAWALNAFLSIRIRKGLQIPHPSMSLNVIRVEDHIDLRLKLHWSMQDCGLTRVQLAADLELEPHVIDNMLDGELEVGHSPYLEAIATKEYVAETNLLVPSIVGERVNRDSAKVALLAV